jgi:hypothetical protein
VTTAEKTDRDTVEKFFKWRDPRKALYMTGVVAVLIGLLCFSAHSFLFGLAAAALGGFLILSGFRSVQALSRYYEVTRMAKACDFDAVRRRSFNKTETDLDSLLDFEAQDLLSLDPDLPMAQPTNETATLARKSVFLYGREDPAGSDDSYRYLKFVRVADTIHAEYTPILVSILYLTRAELIVYVANIDITRGDLRREETSRVFLKDIVEIRTISTSKRLKRIENPALFKSYEKETKLKLEDEIVNRDHVIRVTKTDGRHLDLPVGAPVYEAGKQGILDRATPDENRFTRVARELFKRINDAKATTAQETATP